MNDVANWRKSKKARLYIIGGLLVVVVLLGIIFESIRMWMIGVGVVLLIALGFEVANTDVDLGSVMQGESVSDSVIERDAQGNLETSADGGFLTRVLRDKEGNAVSEGTAGAKYADEYNCDDFVTQSEAQRFFVNAGGVEGDVNGLDGNNDGVACQSLPKGGQ
jgi:hypothetical protein